MFETASYRSLNNVSKQINSEFQIKTIIRQQRQSTLVENLSNHRNLDTLLIGL